MAMFNGKSKFQKKHIAFLTVIPLLVMTSIIQVDCPIDGGTGHLTSTPGMENVELTNPTSKEVAITRDVCGAYIVYIYDITLPLQNHNTHPVEGYVKLVLREFREAKVMDVQYLPVRILGETAVEVTYRIGFTSGLDVELQTKVDAEVLSGDFLDETCNGTGRIPLNAWVLARGLKDDLREISFTQNKLRPPYYIEPDIEDEMIMDEFN
jgi:hypothetical protein